MEQLKRFDNYWNADRDYIEEVPNGRYVAAEEALAAVADRDAEIERQRR